MKASKRTFCFELLRMVDGQAEQEVMHRTTDRQDADNTLRFLNATKKDGETYRIVKTWRND